MKINKIIIAEPSPIISSGLLKYLEDINQLNIVSIVDNIDDLKDKMIIHNPEMIIINPLILGYSNHSLIKKFLQSYPSAYFVAIVSTYVDRNFLKYFKEVIELNENKQKVVNKIINLINSTDDNSSQNDSFDLSNRETDVLVCVAKGMTNKDISDMLNISVHTVITHRKNIVKKTGIKSVSGLTVYALLNNLVEESEIYEN